MTAALLILSGALLGAFLYRWRGGPRWLPAPWLVKAPAWAVFLMAGPAVEVYRLLQDPQIFGLAVGFLLALYTISWGHGVYIDLGRTETQWPERQNAENVRIGRYDEEPELVVFRMKLFPSGEIRGSRAAYELAAMAYRNLALTLPASIAWLALWRPWEALAMALAGIVSAAGYWIGWRLSPNDGTRATQLAEWIVGAVIGAVAGGLIA